MIDKVQLVKGTYHLLGTPREIVKKRKKLTRIKLVVHKLCVTILLIFFKKQLSLLASLSVADSNA